MIFEFVHNESYCYAFVNEKSLQPDYTLTVYILDCNWELGYEVIFFRVEGEWHTDASIAHKHPATFKAICDRLEGIFPGCTFHPLEHSINFPTGKVA